MVKVMLDIPDEIHRRVRIVASLTDRTMAETNVSMIGTSVFIDDDETFTAMVSDLAKNVAEREEGEEGEEYVDDLTE